MEQTLEPAEGAYIFISWCYEKTLLLYLKFVSKILPLSSVEIEYYLVQQNIT